MWEQHYFTSFAESKNLATSDPDLLKLYAAHFPHTDRHKQTMTFEKSPSYLDSLLWPDVPARMKELLPHAKIIFSLCNPAERLYSEFKHTRSRPVKRTL